MAFVQCDKNDNQWYPVFYFNSEAIFVEIYSVAITIPYDLHKSNWTDVCMLLAFSLLLHA